MTTAKREKVLDKIRKLMASAGNNPSAAEAAVAASFAQKLMLEHNIEMTDVQFVELRESDPVRSFFVDPEDLGLPSKKVRVAWSERLAAAVLRAHTCEMILAAKGNGFTVVGRKQDAEVAIFVYHYLYQLCEALTKRGYAEQWRKAEKAGNVTLARGFKESFRMGFVLEVSKRYKEMRARVQDEMLSRGVALVHLAATEKEVEEFMENLAKAGATETGRAVTGRLRSHEEGYRQGREAGSRVDLGRKGVRPPREGPAGLLG